MKVISSPEQFQRVMLAQRVKGRSIGLVPTMGALHEGHLSLVRQARKENDLVCVSIFVNPLQFGPKEDFSRYPKPFRRDRDMLAAEKVDYVFHPSPESLYAPQFATAVRVGEAGHSRLTNSLCGIFRPGHFEGVATVVAKLFNLSVPDRAYFGAKDYQQSLVIKAMVKDLNFPVQIRVMPIVREKDGLALSSRNQYLNADERRRAVTISRTLFWVRDRLKTGEEQIALKALLRQAMRRLKADVDQVQYLELRDPETLEEIKAPQAKMLLAAACYVGKTRLIDNVIIRLSQSKSRKQK